MNGRCRLPILLVVAWLSAGSAEAAAQQPAPALVGTVSFDAPSG